MDLDPTLTVAQLVLRYPAALPIQGPEARAPNSCACHRGMR